MKKILFIQVLLLSILVAACAQSATPTYRLLSTFGGDTLAYLKYNFQDRKDYYYDKTIEALVNDLEIPIKLSLPTSSTVINDNVCEGLIISFDDNSTSDYKLYKHIKAYYLNVSFKAIVPYSDVVNVYRASGSNNWGTVLYNYFKGVTISDILAYQLPDPAIAASYCDPASSGYSPLHCVDQSVMEYYDFANLYDLSSKSNNLTLQDEATHSDGNLVLSGSSPSDLLHPHASVVNSPSLNPQYITVATRIKPQDFYGCGNDAIVNKPFTSHTAPYYQYHLGICGTYCGGGGHYFSFACSINGTGQGMYSPPSVWVPGQWYTVVGTYDGSTMKLFVNGTLVASKAVSGTIDSFSTDEFIGKQGNIDYSIPAELDWVKVYNRALSNTEVAALGGQ